MALNWTDKVDGIDDVIANDINSIAHAVVELEKQTKTAYKYKGDVESFANLPKNPSVGDVYNIRSGYKIYGIMVESLMCLGYGDYPEDEWDYITLSDVTALEFGTKIKVYAEDGTYIGEFSPQNIDGNTVSEQAISGTGLHGVIETIAQRDSEDGYLVFGNEQAIGKVYYFEGIPRGDHGFKELIPSGANVAWNGSEWDMLGGIIDLSGYATKDYVDSLIGAALEGEY